MVFSSAAMAVPSTTSGDAVVVTTRMLVLLVFVCEGILSGSFRSIKQLMVVRGDHADFWF
jgi:hypothetical protein